VHAVHGCERDYLVRADAARSGIALPAQLRVATPGLPLAVSSAASCAWSTRNPPGIGEHPVTAEDQQPAVQEKAWEERREPGRHEAESARQCLWASAVADTGKERTHGSIPHKA
jgi:hypothetical protein